jgi:hypothetical protein
MWGWGCLKERNERKIREEHEKWNQRKDSKRCWCSLHQHCMLMSQLPLLLPFALPQLTTAAVGLDPVISNQRRKRFRDALDVLVQAELELEHVEVTVLVVGAILIGLQTVPWSGPSRHR